MGDFETLSSHRLPLLLFLLNYIIHMYMFTIQEIGKSKSIWPIREFEKKFVKSGRMGAKNSKWWHD